MTAAFIPSANTGRQTIKASGLSRRHFVPLARNGLGDPLNAYPHSMAWHDGALYVGTTRSNLCMLRVSKIHAKFTHWPVECPDSLYDQDMHAQIWRWDLADVGAPSIPGAAPGWRLVYRAPAITTPQGEILPRELGYRCMTVFQGRSDPSPGLYVATYAPARGLGVRILRYLEPGEAEEIPLPADMERDIITLRVLTPFKGRLFISPTGRAGGQPNIAGSAVIYVSDDPRSGRWERANEPGFGDRENLGVFELAACGDWLYAGTGTGRGYQVWRTRAEGPPPYAWERVLVQGAYRGPTNQGVASLCPFGEALYVGSGIQHGGIDSANKVGPAAPELVRIHPDGSWDLIVGNGRETPDGSRPALSGLPPGFGNFFAGYFWRMAAHDGWLYLGTFDWSTMLRYADQSRWPRRFRLAMERVGLEAVFAHQAGADLHRSRDGVNWVPVTRNGFDNPYNYGIRTLESTPFGLAVGAVNPFGPRVAEPPDPADPTSTWHYRANPDGGMEVWLGSRASPHPAAFDAA